MVHRDALARALSEIPLSRRAIIEHHARRGVLGASPHPRSCCTVSAVNRPSPSWPILPATGERWGAVVGSSFKATSAGSSSAHWGGAAFRDSHLP